MQPTLSNVTAALDKLMAETERFDTELQARVKYVTDLFTLLTPKMARLLKYGPMPLSEHLQIRHTGENETEIALYEVQPIGLDIRVSRCTEAYIVEKIGADTFGAMVLAKILELDKKYAQINQQDAYIYASAKQ